MNCEYVHTWLMQVESLLVKDWPRDMNRHLKSCAACAKLARTLFKIEQTWREQPVPAGCDKAKTKFLKSISKPAKPVKTETPAKPLVFAKPTVRPWHPVRWVGAAAMVLIGISAFAYMLFSPAPIQAAQTDIVDRLIDWNLEMTNADEKERKRLLTEEEPKLRRDLQKDKILLTAEERKVAEKLLESGCKLAALEDPEEEAELINDISDILLDRAVAAEKKGNEKEIERCGKDYDRFRQHGVIPMKNFLTPMFKKFSQIKGPEPKKGFEKGPDKGGFDKAAFDRALNQQKQIEKILERLAEKSRPDLHKKFDGFNKKGPGGGMPKFGGKR